jgi:hypothetical protein
MIRILRKWKSTRGRWPLLRKSKCRLRTLAFSSLVKWLCKCETGREGNFRTISIVNVGDSTTYDRREATRGPRTATIDTVSMIPLTRITCTRPLGLSILRGNSPTTRDTGKSARARRLVPSRPGRLSRPRQARLASKQTNRTRPRYSRPCQILLEALLRPIMGKYLASRSLSNRRPLYWLLL